MILNEQLSLADFLVQMECFVNIAQFYSSVTSKNGFYVYSSMLCALFCISIYYCETHITFMCFIHSTQQFIAVCLFSIHRIFAHNLLQSLFTTVLLRSVHYLSHRSLLAAQLPFRYSCKSPFSSKSVTSLKLPQWYLIGLLSIVFRTIHFKQIK